MIDAVMLFVSSITVLGIGYVVVANSLDLVRLLIGLELMFNSIFLALVGLYMVDPLVAFGITIISVLTSATEFIALIVAILSIDRITKNISLDVLRAGGEEA
ncbi:hypothetical protein GCM10007981_00180 [Thermocladium modestius]|uniref:NADH dehydrogenase subunit 4L n=1 Tax=Thermocladium modestius TaxID=62609 RepID=A0A830GT76_9CREN|nr:NADH-quinone oxidoreductase subunit K [Thermocladium modestius]GGP18856.1 hypothetical protein GCM10007981_00180 [Thermocladium modestius]